MSDDAGDQPPPAGPVSAEWPRASVSLLEAHKTLAMSATVQELRRLAARFAELHGCDPDAYLASYGGDFAEACRNPDLPEPAQEVFKEWYWLHWRAEKEVHHRLERRELYGFGHPATGGDAAWFPLRLLTQPHEFRRDVLFVRGEHRYEDVRVVTAAQWREAATQPPAQAAEAVHASVEVAASQSVPAVVDQTQPPDVASSSHPQAAGTARRNWQPGDAARNRTEQIAQTLLELHWSGDINVTARPSVYNMVTAVQTRLGLKKPIPKATFDRGLALARKKIATNC